MATLSLVKKPAFATKLFPKNEFVEHSKNSFILGKGQKEKLTLVLFIMSSR